MSVPFRQKNLLDDLANRHAGSIILRLVYGYDSQPSNDYYVGLASKAVEGVINTVIVGSYLVDFLPIRVCFLLPYVVVTE